jgi:preprotein translocase subunit SecY
MKRIIETIQNIWKIEELRNRIMTTLLFVAVYRLGSYVVLPGVNSIALNEYRAANTQSGIIGLINIFAGGAFSRASIFGLGIMPYITASIIIQLLGMAIPYFQKLQREGESGRKKLNQYTRLLTIAVTAVQAPGYLASQGLYSTRCSYKSIYFMVVSIHCSACYRNNVCNVVGRENYR